jgi:hypothetical protein
VSCSALSSAFERLLPATYELYGNSVDFIRYLMLCECSNWQFVEILISY